MNSIAFSFMWVDRRSDDIADGQLKGELMEYGTKTVQHSSEWKSLCPASYLLAYTEKLSAAYWGLNKLVKINVKETSHLYPNIIFDNS